ncbi:AsmA family protein [Variovorax sp. RHLX14]|uniref:AsmA family protein n=1 Tax=Variovorax sp. RHLX14 TaxID=1259731 RepID=UPI003F48ED28
MNSSRSRHIALRIATVVAGLFVVLALVAVFFPWDVLRGPVNRYVSEKTERKFEITRRLDVGLGLRGATIKLDGIEFANPAWARDPYLVKAERAEFEIRFWPLLGGKVVIPRIALTSPVVGLQMEEDGKRTWALGKDTSDKGTVPEIGRVEVDAGSIDFLARHLGVDLHADIDFDSSAGELPLSFKIKGTYRKQPLKAQGRTGNVLQLTSSGQPPFPLEIDAAAGQTRLKAAGSVASLDGLDGIDAKVDVRGQSLGALYPLLGIALPDTSPYAINVHVTKQGNLWKADALKGKLGLSDIAGEMTFDQGQKVPTLNGQLRSSVMDMDDLGPLIGLPPTARSASSVEGVAAPATVKRAKGSNDKVLPTATLDLERLRAMNADVKYTADRIKNVRDIPLDKGSVHVLLKDGVLTLDPLDLGVAGGKLSGAIRIDSTQTPADIRASLDIRALQLNRMIPKVETMKTSFSNLDGRINLSGRGNSVSEWLGSASGDVAALTGSGRFSNLLLEFAGLDGGEIIKFLLGGDNNVNMRCAALAFDVNKGVMNGREIVFDTTDTVFHATGTANLGTEKMDFVIRPEPKDMSILSLRTPLVIGGSFGDPSVGVKAAPLAARGLAALALGAINPLLALAATIETGPGKDANCVAVLSDARKPSTAGAASGAAKAKTARNPQTAK